MKFLEEFLQKDDAFIRELKRIAAADQDLASTITSTPLELADRFETDHMAFLKNAVESVICAVGDETMAWVKFLGLAQSYFLLFKNKLDHVRESSVKRAQALCEKYIDELNKMKAVYSEASLKEYTDKIQSYLHCDGESYDTSLLSQHLTWSALSKNLSQICEQYVLHQKYPKNRLVQLFQNSDAEFVRRVKWEKLGSDEIAYLGLARLHQIANSDSSPAKTSAREVLTSLVSSVIGQENDLFSCNEEALKSELIKLALHAALHPDKKVVWLGTAEVVCHYRDAHLGEGVYLNCGAAWSWTLNRFWLHAAMSMGYQFQLVEQHSGELQKSLAGRAVNIVLWMLRKILPNTSKAKGLKTSQYDGGTEPTATLQEILFLKSIGCTDKIAQDGALFLYKPLDKRRSQILDLTFLSLKNILGEAAFQEAPAGEQVAPLPPLPSGWAASRYFRCPKAIVDVSDQEYTTQIGGAYLFNQLQALDKNSEFGELSKSEARLTCS